MSTTPIPETHVLDACAVLFGEEVTLCREFLFYLQPSGAKAAYRRRAKEVHPDRLATAPPPVRQRGAERFRQLAEAHELVHAFFRQREAGTWNPDPTPPQPAPAERQHYYRGPLPMIHLSLGRYCYYHGIIPFTALIAALSWQRRQRPAIGEIARNWGWLNEEAIRSVFNTRSSHQTLFGEKAIELGLLTHQQVNALLYYQRFRQQRIGRFFVEQGYVTQEEMERLARELHLHNARIAIQHNRQAR